MTGDTAIALPPLDDVLAGDLIGRTRVGRLLAGYRDRKPADRARSPRPQRLVADDRRFPLHRRDRHQPPLADGEGAIALDARIEIEPQDVEASAPTPNLRSGRIQAGWERDVERRGNKDFHLRPIKPADVSLYPAFLAKVSPDDIRLRFLAPRKKLSGPDAAERSPNSTMTGIWHSWRSTRPECT